MTTLSAGSQTAQLPGSCSQALHVTTHNQQVASLGVEVLPHSTEVQLAYSIVPDVLRCSTKNQKYEGHAVKIKLTNDGVLIKFVNHYIMPSVVPTSVKYSPSHIHIDIVVLCKF